MSLADDDILKKLAFQRGLLTLIKDAAGMETSVEQAIRDVDLLIEAFTILQPR